MQRESWISFLLPVLLRQHDILETMWYVVRMALDNLWVVVAVGPLRGPGAVHFRVCSPLSWGAQTEERGTSGEK